MIIQQLTSRDADAVLTLQQKYAQVFPGAQVFSGELYLSPAFHAGQDVYCAFENDRLLAYAPVYLQVVEAGSVESPNTAWVEIKADPDWGNSRAVKDELYRYILARIQELTARLPAHPLRMNFQYKPCESPAIDYVQSKGFAYTESVFGMERRLADPIPNPPIPEGIELRLWNMENEADQLAYITARNECFPEAPLSLGEWQYFLGLTIWVSGTTIAAFNGRDLVGNVSVYWNNAEIAQSGVKAGFTEFIFVRPAWQGKGIAKALIVEGMRHLKANGLELARLEVRAKNDEALRIYKKLGYQVVNESRFFSKMINE